METAAHETPRVDLPVTRSEAAAASSAQARINIPLNTEAWADLPEAHQSALLWFHQHCLDHDFTLKDAAEALNFDKSTIWRVLKGSYEGSWPNVVRSVESFRKITEQRAGIQKNEFVENRFTKLIFNALSYALANNSVTLIIGESRFGKTASAEAWRDANNHGRSVLIRAPAYGGTKALLNEIAHSCGYNQNKSGTDLHKAVLRAFNRNRILIVDEAHQLLPTDKRTTPVSLEVLRDIHDRTGCALALIATARFSDVLHKSGYMFEQLIGRIGMPVRLPREIKPEDILGIVKQYLPKPGAEVMAAFAEMVNGDGRIGMVVETLKVASRVASRAKEKMTDQHVLRTLAFRRQQMGEIQFARKERR